MSVLRQAAEDDNLDAIRALFRSMGMATAQVTGTIDLLENIQKKSPEKNEYDFISEVNNGGALRQFYAYLHIGANAWLFWRFEYVKTAKGWRLSGAHFNGDYNKVLAPSFPGAIER